MSRPKFITNHCALNNHKECPGYYIFTFPTSGEMREIMFCFCPCWHTHLLPGEQERLELRMRSL